jgi:vacuolar-type H+-ATPase subunit I/STV1
VNWHLLIYTVPSLPSRKRAAVWREVKRIGAVYLRDGVCALPARADTLATLFDVAQQIEDLGGQATVAKSCEIDAAKSLVILETTRSQRAAEYADLMEEITAFLGHIRQEMERRAFTFRQIEDLEADLGKLQRWLAQVTARDLDEPTGSFAVQELLDDCERLVKSLIAAYGREEAIP